MVIDHEETQNLQLFLALDNISSNLSCLIIAILVHTFLQFTHIYSLWWIQGSCSEPQFEGLENSQVTHLENPGVKFSGSFTTLLC